jgi:hypothetical protein
MKLGRTAATLAGVAVFFGCLSLAWACNVPVFRYALERWRPDSYRVVLFHRSPLTDAQREEVQPFLEQQETGVANLTFRSVDVSQLDAQSEEHQADAALYAALSPKDGEPALPRLVVQYPAHLNIQKPVWSGAPGREAIAALIDSPARKELARRLAEGQTAVWLVLESGQKERDDAAAALVEAEIKKLEQDLELPELTDAPEDAIAAGAPLKVAFSALRVRKDERAEQALVAILIGSEPDLAERTDPMVFPVFGRGRALWALIGPGITAKNIHDSAGFLVGPCSCEVKELNPGFDLLLSANWDELLTPAGMTLTAVETKTIAPPTEAELVPIPAGTQAQTHVVELAPVPPPTIAIAPITLIAVGGGLVGLLVVAGIIVAAAGSRQARD